MFGNRHACDVDFNFPEIGTKDDPGRCQKLKCVIDRGARRLTQTTVLDLPGVKVMVKVMVAHGARGLFMGTECES